MRRTTLIAAAAVLALFIGCQHCDVVSAPNVKSLYVEPQMRVRAATVSTPDPQPKRAVTVEQHVLKFFRRPNTETIVLIR